jgi:photosystem II stability/assembly factor-like uncharacterized protein
MKVRDVLPIPLVLLFACSSSHGGSAQPNDASTSGDGDDGAAADAGGDDASDAADGPDAYEQSILSTHWVQLAKGPVVLGGAKQDDIYFPSPMHGYAVSGPASAIYETKDGGGTFQKVYTHAGTYFRSILFVDDMHGFASNLGAGLSPQITDTNVLYETKDGGATWNPVTTITGTMPQGICNQTKVDAQHLVAVGRVNGPAFMLTSSDGGATWASTDLNMQFSMLIDARFTTPTEGILVGMGASSGTCTIFHTGDGGKTLDKLFESKTAGSLCWKISFPSDQVGYVSVQDQTSGPPTFVKTTDAGKTWTEMKLPKSVGAYPGIGIGFITEDIGWVSADDPTLPTMRTADGGLTWVKDADLKSPINRFRFVDANTGYAIGGAVWKLSVTGH